MVDDKDLHAVMSMLPDDAIYYWTQPSTHRAFPVENVAETADDYDLHGMVFPTVLEAYQAALQDADEQDFYLRWRLQLCGCRLADMPTKEIAKAPSLLTPYY